MINYCLTMNSLKLEKRMSLTLFEFTAAVLFLILFLPVIMEMMQST